MRPLAQCTSPRRRPAERLRERPQTATKKLARPSSPRQLLSGFFRPQDTEGVLDRAFSQFHGCAARGNPAHAQALAR